MSKDNKTVREKLEKIYGKHYYKDISGNKYTRLTAIQYVYTKNKKAYWLCKCECGKEKIVSASDLTSGNTKSCGCLHHDTAREHYLSLNRIHGMKGTKIYSKWLNMKARCYKKSCNGYKNYGGRGIKVCDEWKNSFVNFYKWSINNGYQEGLTIERIDVNKDYSLDNCKWITNLEQQNNKRNNTYIVYKNEKHTIAEWSRITGINKNTISGRLRKGWSVEKILSV